MPTQIKIINGRDFLRAKAEGVLDLAESEKMLVALAEASADLDNFEVILDVRQAQSELGVTDMWDLAAKFSEHRRTFKHRTAILVPAERFDRASFFALCARNRGLNLNAFISYEEAMEWLISDGV